MPAPDELIDDVLGVNKTFLVNVPKVFFRISDNLSEQSPAYLVQGDFVECGYELKNYYGCTYTVGNKQTAGFLPKNSLTDVPVKPVENRLSRVTATKAYLYSSPENQFRTKIYLIKDDTLNCDYRTGLFLRCSYTTKDREEQIDVTYHGFFRITDVKSLRND